MTPPLCSVYGLFSTEDSVVRYIGQTVQTLLRRQQQHLAEAARPPGTTRCHRWIRKVIRSGHKIGIRLIEANCLWDAAEKKWIAEYRRLYPELMTNISHGGCGYSGKRSAETRARMSGPLPKERADKLRARLASPEMRKRIALGQRGNTKGLGEKNGMAVLTESQVIEIRLMLQERKSISLIAKSFGVTKAAISKIRTGRTWKYLGGLALQREDNGRHCD